MSAEVHERFDLFVIGAGSGGVRAARMAARHGVRVGIAEAAALGGTCVNVGCVPKKLFVHAAHVREELAVARHFGWQVEGARFDWSVLSANKDREIARLNGIYERLLVDAGVTILHGWAHLEDPHTVRIGHRRVHADRILIATGSRPQVPPVPGGEHVVTSTQMFALEALPGRAVVVGGGYIAVEFAGILHGFGVDTTLLYRGPLFLRGFDDDARRCVADGMRARGIAMHFDTDVSHIERTAHGLVVWLADGERMETDLVLYATGRVPNTDGLGLENAGVALDERGAVVVDEHFQTTQPHIYALGDVIDRLQLTPVAIAEAMHLVAHLYGGEARPIDYQLVPSAVFSQPQLASCGLTESEARQRYPALEVYRSRFRPLKLTLTDSPEQALVKVLVDGDSDRVVGVHLVGDDAAEAMQGVAVAMQGGLTKRQLDATIGIHPTFAEELVTLREPVGD